MQLHKGGVGLGAALAATAALVVIVAGALGIITAPYRLGGITAGVALAKTAGANMVEASIIWSGGQNDMDRDYFRSTTVPKDRASNCCGHDDDEGMMVSARVPTMMDFVNKCPKDHGPGTCEQWAAGQALESLERSKSAIAAASMAPAK